ncbi:MAG: acylphosphatase [Chitinophagales bacterium]|nr:acylphosphatase [Chitinophagales bacterium]
MIKKLHYNIKVTGKVQGVWFRDSTRKKAMELGVSGFVRNEPDGSVYLEAEGTQDSLQHLAAWCAVGPPKAKVENVEVIEAEMKNFSKFEIT